MSTPKGTQLPLLYFKLSEKSNIYGFYACGKEVKQNGSGVYTNLDTHITSNHKETIMNRLQEKQTVNSTSFSPIHSQRRAKWFTIGSNVWLLLFFPFSFCKNVVVKHNFKYSSISQNPLTNYMHEVCKLVEARVSNAFPENFAIIFTRWSAGSTYYVTVTAIYVEYLTYNESYNENEKLVTSKIVQSALLGCLPIKYEKS